MVNTFMLTIPRTIPKKAIRLMIEMNDCKKWIVAKEEGKGGYKHYQIRLQTSNFEFFEWMKKNIPSAHVEEAQDIWEYERKEGVFWTSDDTPQIRAVRFGKPTKKQKDIIATARSQNDRQVDVWYDPKGNHGKTWLTVHLWEHGQALVVPRYATGAKELSAFICSAYKGEEFIIIDIPRAGKVPTAVYETIESVKDGLVFDPRYSGRAKNIRGVKVIVFTNTKLEEEKLSKDRWRLHGFGRGSS
uniref:Rep protein n=1 Tax=uncultured prokaryote TaxID=198431 RepID=A0A0H5Q8Y4_9ZZZZ|nr:hypothetical protein [uncultured prokaryote]